MKKPLYIYGAGGLGREVLSWVRLLEEYEPIAFLDDTITPHTTIKGLSVLGGMNVLSKVERPLVILAMGNPIIKRTLAQQLQQLGVEFPVLVHPSIQLGDSSTIKIGKGSILTAGSILTTEITIGEHVLINLNCTIGHDTTIGSYTSLMCGINVAGEVTCGQSVLIGSGANIRNRIVLGDECTVGMGAAVISNVANGSTVVGVPAKAKR